MKFSFLPSLGALAGWGLSRYGQTSFQAPHHATSPGPGPVRYPAFVFNNQALFIGNSAPDYSKFTSFETPAENAFENAIFSLDLSVPWSASAPAWHKIDRPADFIPDNDSNKSGQMVMNKDGSIIYFFQGSNVRPYYVHKGKWGPVMSLTSGLTIRKSLMVDSDLGHIYGIEKTSEWSDYEWTLRMFDPVTNVISIISVIPPEANPQGGLGVYSSARKSFFFSSSKGAFTFYEYNIANKAWTFVPASGDVPSPRRGIACYAPINNGKQILMVGGARRLNLGSLSEDSEVVPTPSEPWPYPRSTWPPQKDVPTAAWPTYPTRTTQFILPRDNFPTGQPQPPSYEDWTWDQYQPSPIPSTNTYPGYNYYRGGYNAPRPPPATTTYPGYGYYRGGYNAPRPPPASTTYPGYDYYRGGFNAPRPPPASTTYPGYNHYRDGYPMPQPPSPRPARDVNQVLNDVFMFDVETFVWTKVSTTPIGYHGSACAVSGDSLILYGGYKTYYSEDDQTENDNVPSIYDIKRNTWVSTYIPH
ncbi:hypothetical protein BGZ93_001910 [Podila epicladia]|nr:hypothetical protein BGZ92_002045 [Podila epicladia]KAG0097806.1 hypothetical protein BGZ93_001910 [Podila epicladia]